MPLFFEPTRLFQVALYTEQCVMRGQVCINPEVRYGKAWRESNDLDVWTGSEDSLVQRALETLRDTRATQHARRCAVSVLRYFDEPVPAEDAPHAD